MNPPKARDTGKDHGPTREDLDKHKHPDIQREEREVKEKKARASEQERDRVEKFRKKGERRYRRNPGAEMPTAGLGQMGRAGTGLNHILGPGLPFPRAHLRQATPLRGEMPRPYPQRSQAPEPRRHNPFFLFGEPGSNPASLFGGSGGNVFGPYRDPFSGPFSRGMTITPDRQPRKATRKRRRRK